MANMKKSIYLREGKEKNCKENQGKNIQSQFQMEKRSVAQTIPGWHDSFGV